MSSPKKQALDIVKKLPGNATWDDIIYRITVGKKIASGIKAADDGMVLSQEKAKLFFELTTEVRRAMIRRRISENTILRDFEKSRRLHTR